MPYKPAELASILRPFLLAAMEQSASGTGAQADWDARYLRRYKIRLYDPSGPTVTDFEPTSAGLADAIAAASSGDTIWLPPGMYSGDVTVPDGVTLAAMSPLTAVLTGQMTTGNNGLDPDDPPSLSGLRVVRTANSADVLRGIVAPTTGGARAVMCAVSVAQAGTGNAYALAVESGGDLEALGCILHAESVGGTAWHGYRDPGVSASLYVINSQAWVDAPFSE
jgi:hypothetical protein